MTQSEFPALERPLFFEGQRLTSADLAAVHAFDRELHRLHNRSLHGWGVVRGLAAGGARGGRTVTLTPGYALDCLGRELVLSEPLELAVPAVAAATAYRLTVSHAAGADLAPEVRSGACGTSGAVRLADVPVVRFQDVTATGEAARRPGLDVVVAGVSVAGCRLAANLSGAEREALAPEQPYVAGGQTPAGSTAWRSWPGSGAPAGVAATVPTAAAGFHGTPSYQARVAGSRIDPEGFVVDGYAHVSGAGADAFDLVVVLPGGHTTGAFGAVSALNPSRVLDGDYPDRLRGVLGWHVVWMGIES